MTELVNGCDAGREGELIFRLAVEMAGCTKPVWRLWISSMEDTAIREGFPTWSRAAAMNRCTIRPCAVLRRTG